TFIVRGGFVEILTPAAARELTKTPVHVTAKQQTLADVLEDLSEQTGASIVVDLRGEEKAQTLATATLQDVPLETAVRVLANMADLKTIVLDNLILVSTGENAEEMCREYFRNSLNGQATKVLRALENAEGRDGLLLREQFKDAVKQLKLAPAEGPKPAVKTEHKK
ncbi:MAG TPA: hypothetical protein VKS79_25035, partial [Gemmataceae bacterium]|nr:hypothetical protein [Gemmataceae bacterium]